MVKSFIPNCDLCGEEIPVDRHRTRRVPANGVELLIVALENDDPDLELVQNPDGSVDLDACFDCYSRVALSHSEAIN